tara:strand:- start:3775 stop:5163 length:1389 start_codon:yes stop_codon:yes gene_type:complete
MAKKKILLLSDDMRLHSGVGTVSKEIVRQTIHHFDWVQLGGAIKHPEEGKIVDLAEDFKKQGAVDPYCKVYPTSGYGNPMLLRQIIQMENPDAILHFTDPRFWIWLYQMEHEIRQMMPLMFYTIWDDLPFPRWNEPFYESCDQLMCISKQTTNIVRNVVRKYPKDKWQINYVPHGINEKVFFPIEETHDEYGQYLNFKDTLFENIEEPSFVVYWNNRNIRRKNPGDLILAFNEFVKTLPEDEKDDALLLMHTDKVDDNGTDLPAVIKELCTGRVMFTGKKVTEKEMNYLYNIADVTVNIASNEGFGLSGAESLMSGTPIINNVTGGLQDHCGFMDDDGNYLTEDDFNAEWGSNHDKRYQKCGVWAKPVFPSNRSLQGSPATPYIFDDRCKFEHVAKRLREWYDTSKDQRREYGLRGREFVTDPKIGMSATEMGHRFIKHIDSTLDKWTPKAKHTLYNVGEMI